MSKSTEDKVVAYVQKHARYRADAPAYARYAVRYPPHTSEATFADSPRGLVIAIMTKFHPTEKVQQ